MPSKIRSEESDIWAIDEIPVQSVCGLNDGSLVGFVLSCQYLGYMGALYESSATTSKMGRPKSA